MRDRERESSLDVQIGLHLVQYVRSADANDPPIVKVRAAGTRVQLIGDPRQAPGELASPGSVLVVRAEGPSTVQILVRSRTAGGSTDARVEIRPLGSPRLPQPGTVRATGLPDGVAAIRLLGHLARRGDVWADAGQWVGGPSSPLPLEGFEIHLEGGDRSALEYQVLSGAGEARWSPWVKSGAFAGSRGRRSSLLGVRLRMARGGSLRASALFLGAAVLTKAGPELEFVGQTGREPLLGLSVSLDGGAREWVRVEEVAQERSARVRVFRASSL